jgi:class 3 adenylate cyclase/tetratricopeptide (TPR) repeat protein
MPDTAQLERAISELEQQRESLGDAVVDTAIEALRRDLRSATSDPESHSARRQVTVLFADVSGFTAMSERLDIEDVAEAMRGLWDRMDRLITDHGGVVVQHVGDRVMGMWGASQLDEDEAERAINAALKMQVASEGFADHLLPDFDGPRPRLRIGLNTGPALVGTVSSLNEFSAMGDTVNVASRAETAADPGEVVITRNTYRHVTGVFDCRPRGAVRVKGKRDPLELYVVLRVRPRAFRVRTPLIDGVETKMVGRNEQLELLQGLTQRSAAEHEVNGVCVLGEAGVGKSRLLYEYRSWLDLRDQRVTFFYAGCRPFFQSTPFAFIRELLSFRFEILLNERRAAARAKIFDGFAQFLGDPGARHATTVCAVLGYAADDERLVDPEVVPEEMLAAIGALLSAAAADAPVVCVLDDLHWADDQSLRLLERLLDRRLAGPITIVLAARPELRERSSLPSAVRARATLEPLRSNSAERLVEQLLQNVPHPPAELVRLIAERGGGNPFFIEELVTTVIESEVISGHGDEREVVKRALERFQLPSTLTAVVQSRIDRLSELERATAEAAAVFGNTFPLAALTSMLAEADPGLTEDDLAARVATALVGLERRQLVHPDEAFASGDRFIFRHAIIREIVYDAVLRARKASLHRGAAGWLAAQPHPGIAALVGQHWEAAGDRDPAADWYLRAGLQALRASGFQEATITLRRVIELGSDAQRLPGLLGLGHAVAVLGDLPTAIDYLDQAIEIASATAQYESQLRAITEKIRIASMNFGLLDECERLINRGNEILDSVPDGAAKVAFLRQTEIVGMVMIGDFDRSEEPLLRATELAETVGDDYELAMTINTLCHVYVEQGRFGEAIELAERVEQLARKMNNQRVEMCAHSHYALAALHSGDPSGGYRHFLRAQEINRANADAEKLADVGNYLGDCLLQMNEPARARHEYHDALAVGWEHNAIAEVLRSVAGLARCKAAAGQIEAARRLARLVVAHPACNFEARRLCGPLLEEDPGGEFAVDLVGVVETLLSEGG